MDTTMQLLTPDSPAGSTRRRAVGAAATALTIVLALGTAACGDDSDDATIPLSEWLGEFDQMCLDLQAEATPELTDDEFMALSDRYLAQMRAVSAPAELADTATELLDLIEESTGASDLDDAEIAALDERASTALTELGVSEACVRGVPG
jgi:hypothetical protein